MSDYYNATGYPANAANGDSASARSEFNAIALAFNKLPTLTGNALKIIRVNAAAVGLEAATLAAADIALASDLAAHLSDTTDAHDASAISNVPAGNIAATTVQAAINELDGEKVQKTSATGSAQLPVGTTAQEDGALGSIRYDSTLGQFRGWGPSGYALLGGGATGGGSDTVFVLNGNHITQPFTVPTGSNAHTVGPVTIDAAVTLNGRWVIS